MCITFSTCFYSIKSKFNDNTYYQWMSNLLKNVNNFYLVVYTDDINFEKIKNIVGENNNVKIILKPIEEFYNYKYKDYWIKNQLNNPYLNYISWELQLIWSEKISFVLDTCINQYFNTDLYGWLDIGYFRCVNNDIKVEQIAKWPNPEKIKELDINKIYYANTNNDNKFNEWLFNIVNDKNDLGLPKNIIPHTQNSIAGGFFISHKNNLEEWRNTFDEKLKLYFENNYLVKDDQIILVDCIMSNIDKFCILQENDPKFDNWFLFQRALL